MTFRDTFTHRQCEVCTRSFLVPETRKVRVLTWSEQMIADMPKALTGAICRPCFRLSAKLSPAMAQEIEKCIAREGEAFHRHVADCERAGIIERTRTA